MPDIVESAKKTALTDTNLNSPSPSLDALGDRVPIPTLERLTTYLRSLVGMSSAHIETVSSAEIERSTGINAAQFRKDLSYFGEFGKPGVGYSVAELESRISRILKIHELQPILLIGVGNLGAALVSYPGLEEHKFRIVAAFDNSPHKIGTTIGNNLEVLDFARFGEINAEFGARMAILAVPQMAAQAVADVAIANGIRAILNFAPVLLRTPKQVIVRNVSFLQELAVLSYHLSESNQSTS